MALTLHTPIVNMEGGVSQLYHQGDNTISASYAFIGACTERTEKVFQYLSDTWGLSNTVPGQLHNCADNGS